MRILECLPCVFCVMTLTVAMEVVFMDDWCGRTKYISGSPAIRVKLTTAYKYQSDWHCTFTVKGDCIDEDQLMVQFRDLSTESDCDNDWLTLYDGDDRTGTTIGRNKFCGYTTPTAIYTTSSSSLTFYFKSDSTLESSGFDIILTHYQTGICDSWEINCNNGRCVDDSLSCTGYNPCGDYSDCSDKKVVRTGSLVGILVGSITSVITVIIVVVVVILVRRRRNPLIRRQVPTVTMATVSTSPFPQQGYVYPGPQQVHVSTVPVAYTTHNQTLYQPPPTYSG